MFKINGCRPELRRNLDTFIRFHILIYTDNPTVMHPDWPKIFSALLHPRLAYARFRHRLNFDELLVMHDLKEAGFLEGIDTVIDAGAHHGSFAMLFSYVIPSAEIICFEPVVATFEVLQKETKNNPRIHAFCMGLGSQSGKATMNVSELDQASSLLPMTETHKELWPSSAKSKSCEVQVVTLDEFSRQHPVTGEIFLKADIQGFELEMLNGASALLGRVRVLRLELSFVPLYVGAPSFSDVCVFLEKAGFSILSMAGTVKASSRRVPVQGDFFFVRSKWLIEQYGRH